MPEHAALFPYQREGTEWLGFGKHRYLADEMGLGKTPQAVAALDASPHGKDATVVCPAFLRENWTRELRRWSGNRRAPPVLSYEVAARDGLPESAVYIFDEAHYLKSPTTKRTKTLLGLDRNRLDPNHPLRRAVHIWPLSGTPMPNGNPGEVWPWLRTFGATQLPHTSFVERYAWTRQTQWGPQFVRLKPDRLSELKQLMAPFFKRRLAREVLGTEEPHWGTISLAGTVGFDRWFDGQTIFVGEELPDEEDEHLSRLRRKIGEVKAAALAPVIAAELESGAVDKIVLFGWHKTALDVLETALAKFGLVRADGDTPMKQRQAAVDRFQEDQTCRVFLGNIQAAGTGLTLTAARHLVFVEMSWNPGDNAQAAKRVDRIGQTRPVFIRTAVLAGTVDEAVVGVTTRKTREILKIWTREIA